VGLKCVNICKMGWGRGFRGDAWDGDLSPTQVPIRARFSGRGEGLRLWWTNVCDEVRAIDADVAVARKSYVLR